MTATPGTECIHIFVSLTKVNTHKCRIDFQSVLWDIFELINVLSALLLCRLTLSCSPVAVTKDTESKVCSLPVLLCSVVIKDLR
jgi:hypothetical protein